MMDIRGFMETAMPTAAFEIAQTSDADNTVDDSRFRSPLVVGNKDFGGVTDTVASVAENKIPLAWYVAMARIFSSAASSKRLSR